MNETELRQLADLAVTEPLVFQDRLDRLAYEGETAVIIQLMQTAWPSVAETAAPSISADFAARATDAIIYRYLETAVAPNANDPQLQADLERFFAISPERLDQYIAFLNGQIVAQWQNSHFEPLAANAQNLQTLAIGFTGHVYRTVQIPLTKADLVRQEMPRYLLDRAAGTLHPRQPANFGRSQPPQLPPEPIHPLAPDDVTMQRYLERLTLFDAHSPRAAALHELAPHWLDYLRVCGLTMDDGRRTMDDQ
jgi:hypothetical protein